MAISPFRLALALFCSFFTVALANAQNTGIISGRVIESQSQTPIPDATIFIPTSGLKTVSDSAGYFKLEGIPVGSYSLVARALSYQEVTKFDVIVATGNANIINFELVIANSKEISITQSPMVKAAESPLSVQVLSQQEIRSYPGGNNDIAKVVQALPGVSGTVGFRNDVVIRGGAPNENVYYLDGVEIPNINHFSTQGSAGGPVGLLNVSFIEEVTLNTGAFPGKYDNVLGGVLQFKQRNGNKDRHQGNFRLGASEFAITTEGPLGKAGSDKLTYIASIRRSYLQLLFQVIDLPFLPSYWDGQYKVNYKIDAKNELNFIGIGSIDDFTLNPPKEATLEQQAILDGIPTIEQRTTNHGISWKRLINNGFMLTTISANYLKNNYKKYDNNDESSEANKRLFIESIEWETKLRMEVNQYFDGWKFSYGLNAQRGDFRNNAYNRIQVAITDTMGNVIQPRIEYSYNTNLIMYRYGLFSQVSKKFFGERFGTSFGLRTDMNSFTNDGNNALKQLSPRLSLSYVLNPKWNINATAGQYYKIPPYTILGFQNNGQYVNQNARYIRSQQASAGVEYNPDQSSRITLEGFYKYYNYYPVSTNDSISLANRGGDFSILGNEPVQSIGNGRAYGAELFIQKKFTGRWYGILSYTFYYSEYTAFDPDKFISSSWDNRHLLSVTGGYRFNRGWNLGIRYRLLGGNPYTPFDTVASVRNYVFAGQGIPDNSRLNSLRLGVNSQLDVRVEKFINFKTSTLTVYVDIQNALNAANLGTPSFTLDRDVNNNFIGANGEPFNGQNGVPVFLQSSTAAFLPTIGLIWEL